ncbi:hypothetical protein ACU5AX_04895 [Sphingomonas sp. XXL09]|uniref:hypothetical protein n=1 Tax=Sphingomonas sp. XXL09 TaxID=3457787 RepID=UPI00406BD885
MTAIQRFLAVAWQSYRDGPRVLAGLPWLFGAIIAWEFAQHVMEYRIGFFVSREAAKAVSQDGGRMALGWVKMILVYVGGFFAIRYLMLGQSRAVLRPALRTMLRYLPYVAYALIVFAIIFYADRLVAPAHVMTLRGLVGLTQIAIEPLLMPWIVSAATDGPVRTPWQSANMVGRWYPWALALFFVGRLPISLVHQGLGTWAMGRDTLLLWLMLAADAVTVGLLIAIIPALSVRIVAGLSQAPARPTAALAPA